MHLPRSRNANPLRIAVREFCHYGQVGTRWQSSDAPRGDSYDARWRSLEAEGHHIHGEADLVESLLAGPGKRVLDAGCGTGRVAIELARRGFDVTGVDVDAAMLATARAKAPDLTWIEGDLAEFGGYDGEPFDLVAMPGNVMIFLNPGSERAVLAAMASLLVPDGLLVAGFQLRPGRLPLADYDRFAELAGLTPVARWATWDREPFTGGDYAVSVHRR